MEELRAANKALIESVKTGLRGNEQAFADFKDVSARYNRGEMNTLDYYRRIIRLGLSSVVPELGRLCPDPVKGKELIDAHAAQLAREQAFPPVAPSSSSVSQLAKTSSGAGKGKGALEGSTQSSRVSSSGSSRQPPDEEVEVLSKDGYRTGKGKSRLDDGNSSTLEVTEGRPTSRKPQVLVKATGGLLEPSSDSAHQPGVSGQAKVWTCESCTLENQGDSAECVACGRDGPEWAVASRSGKGTDSAGNDKRKKKLSKFQRVRLGDGSAAALLDSVANPNPWGVISDVESPAVPTTEVRGGFGRGAWANGGGNRLVAGTRKNWHQWSLLGKVFEGWYFGQFEKEHWKVNNSSVETVLAEWLKGRNSCTEVAKELFRSNLTYMPFEVIHGVYGAHIFEQSSKVNFFPLFRKSVGTKLAQSMILWNIWDRYIDEIYSAVSTTVVVHTGFPTHLWSAFVSYEGLTILTGSNR
jgi:hypothetical protein